MTGGFQVPYDSEVTLNRIISYKKAPFFYAVVIKLEKQSYPTAAAAESMTVRLIRALKQHPVLNSTKKS